MAATRPKEWKGTGFIYYGNKPRMETLTYEQRCELYRKLLLIMEVMYKKKLQFFKIFGAGWLYRTSGFCYFTTKLSYRLFKFEQPQHFEKSIELLQHNVPELAAMLPKSWDGCGHLYYGKNAFWLRLKIMRKVVQTLNDKKWPFDQLPQYANADNGGGATSAITP